MAGSQPFMYDAVPRNSAAHPYHDFDPKSVSRASLTPKPPRPKQVGPLVSFNKHPDSYLILPYGNTNAKPMNPSIKTHVKNTRMVQLVLRCVELLGAIGLLVTMAVTLNVPVLTGWLMRIPAGVAILHTSYGIYHLSRKSSGRTPASSASYMLFASAFDVSVIPFYALAALQTSAQYNIAKNGKGQDGQWSSLLSGGQALMPKLSGIAFLSSVIAGGLHVISFAFSIFLAVTFRKITQLPPDMNPLEDNLTSRHKRNKSSMSASTLSEKRTSAAIEDYRRSGAPYEELARPPTIPFFHTRQGSTDSFSTYASTPPRSRDSRVDLPSRQYQLQSKTNSPRTSIIDLKRASFNNSATVLKPTFSPPKPSRTSYVEVPLTDSNTDTAPQHSATRPGNFKEAWYAAGSLPINKRSPHKSKASYHPLFNAADMNDHEEEDDDISNVSTTLSSHPNPLDANPTPRGAPHVNNSNYPPTRNNVLSEISLNSNANTGSGDLADMGRDRDQDSQLENPARAKKGREIDQFKARFYGELRAATPPVLVGSVNGRQASSGNDYGPSKGGFKLGKKREVSGKIVEEGRAGHGSWGARFRKVSGK